MTEGAGDWSVARVDEDRAMGSNDTTGDLYRRFVGPLLQSDGGADAEQLSQLTLAGLSQVALRRH